MSSTHQYARKNAAKLNVSRGVGRGDGEEPRQQRRRHHHLPQAPVRHQRRAEIIVAHVPGKYN